MNNNFSTRIILSFIFCMASIFASTGYAAQSEDTSSPETIILDCLDCKQTQSSTRNYLQATITNISAVDRLVYIQTYNKNSQGKNSGEVLYFVYFINSGDSSNRADFYGTTSIKCVRRCDDY